MNHWSTYAWVVAAAAAAVWLYSSRLIVKLRSEYVRLHPRTGEQIAMTGAAQRLAEIGQPTVIRLGDKTEQIYYLGQLVSRWDRLSPEKQRRIDLIRKIAGAGLVVSVLVALVGAVVF